MDKITVKQILKRIDLAIPLQKLIRKVAVNYGFGKVISWEPIRVGYSDVNIKMVTTKGKYLTKIFNKDKLYKNITDYIKGLVEFRQAGIPTPNILKHKNKFLYKIPGQSKNSYLCVIEFFDGKNFNEIKLMKKDLVVITSYIAKIHKLSFSIHKNYDSWGTVNLLKEYRMKKKYLTAADLEVVKPIIDEFKSINFRKLPKSIIHGDLHKDHVLKNRRGKYCIIDLDVMDYNARILDLAIFIALFAFDLKSSERDKSIYNYVLRNCQKYIFLDPYELEVLPILIKATYAIYLIRSNYEIVVNEDKSSQTVGWLELARKGCQ